MTWKRAGAGGLFRCGCCKKAIAKGAIYAKTKHDQPRCESCARLFEDPPDESG